MNELDIDSLFSDPSDINEIDASLPEQCERCHNNVICSILPTILSLSKLGIQLEIKKCRYLNPINKKS